MIPCQGLRACHALQPSWRCVHPPRTRSICSGTSARDSNDADLYCWIVPAERDKQRSPPEQLPENEQQYTQACQPMLASPEPEDNAEVSPESVNSTQVCDSNDPRRSSAHSTAQQEQRSSTKRASAKRASSRSKQGSMGPAGYPLTPVSDTPSHLTEASGTRPTSSSLTPGLHEVPPLSLDKSRTSAPTSAFYANHTLADKVVSAAGATAYFCDICYEGILTKQRNKPLDVCDLSLIHI